MIVNGMNIWDDPAVLRAAYARAVANMARYELRVPILDSLGRYMLGVFGRIANVMRKGGAK